MENKGFLRGLRSSFSLSHIDTNRSSFEKLTPFVRIMSNKNLKHGVMPTFLRAKSDLPDLSTIRSQRKESLFTYQTDSEMIDYINSIRNPIQVVLKIGKYPLTQNDLKSLVAGAVSRNTIDAILIIIKHLNAKHCKNNESSRQIFVAKSSFTDKLFNNERICGNLNFENTPILIFPVFIGHWTLLLANCLDMSIKYYDPLKNFRYVKDILKNFYEFFKPDALEKKKSIHGLLKEMIYQRVVMNDMFKEEDSAVFVLRVIFEIAAKGSADLKSAKVDEYRMMFLKMILQYGNL